MWAGRLVAATKIAIVASTIGAVAWTFVSHGIDDILSRNIWLAAASVLPLNLLSLLVNARRFSLLARQPPAPARRAFEALILSSGLNVVIPGRIAEFVKVTYMRRHCGISTAHGLSAVFLERFLDMAAIGMIGIAALAVTELSLNSVILVAPALAIVALALAPWLAHRFARRLPQILSLEMRAFFERGLTHVSNLRDGAVLLRVSILTGLVWLLLLLTCVAFLEIQDLHETSVGVAVTLFVATVLAVAIPGPPAGIGTYQAAVIVVLLPAGFAFHEALLFGVVLQIAQSFVTLVFLPIVLLRKGTGSVALLREATSAFQVWRSRMPERSAAAHPPV